MAGGYQINPDEVKRAGAETRSRAQRAASWPSRVDSAQVPGGAWGLIGHMLPMYDTYQQTLGDLSRHAQAIREFLDWAGDNLGATADSYRGTDQDLEQSFVQLAQGLDP